MNNKGMIVDMDTGEELTGEQMRAMHENVVSQVQDKTRKNKDHIRLSLIWNTQQNLRQIQRQLVDGYSFDYNALTALVNTMFGFISGVAKPTDAPKAIDDVQLEEIVK